ncbi:MAG: hypothetical protein AAFN30_17370 [Actinomycetota bacterium]
MTASRNRPPMPSGVGPYEVDRAGYFARRHQANEERRRRADDMVRILESNLELQLERLRQLEASVAEPAPSRAERSARQQDVRRQVRHVDDIRAELVKQRRLRTRTHDDHLIEWAVEHDGRRLPSPGQYLLARRSTKPFPQHPTA